MSIIILSFFFFFFFRLFATGCSAITTSGRFLPGSRLVGGTNLTINPTVNSAALGKR